jgi:putative chitinase
LPFRWGEAVSARKRYRLGWRALRRVIRRKDLTPAEYKLLARQLAVAMVRNDIRTTRRATMFIAQTAHESGGYRWREELASGAAYEGRFDLGNTQPGDGPRFKGRGYIQITGRANVAQMSGVLGVDFVSNPELLATRKWAARSAAAWWRTHGCSQLADTGDFVAVTRRINGGTRGLEDRLRYYRRARRPWNRRMLVPRRRRRP